MYIVYVLRDDSGKIYKGYTNDLMRRLKEHNSGKTQTTSRMGSLSVAYTERFVSRDEARAREIYFKTAAGRRFLRAKMGL